jgi:hypothetical protein
MNQLMMALEAKGAGRGDKGGKSDQGGGLSLGGGESPLDVEQKKLFQSPYKTWWDGAKATIRAVNGDGGIAYIDAAEGKDPYGFTARLRQLMGGF